MSRSYGTHTYYTSLTVFLPDLDLEWDPNFEYRDWEVEIELNCTYPGDPGRLSGPPENCYPPEAMEFELDRFTLFVSDRIHGKIIVFQATNWTQAELVLGAEAWCKLYDQAHEDAGQNFEIEGPPEE